LVVPAQLTAVTEAKRERNWLVFFTCDSRGLMPGEAEMFYCSNLQNEHYAVMGLVVLYLPFERAVAYLTKSRTSQHATSISD
jgi:hypothetical protein